LGSPAAVLRGTGFDPTLIGLLVGAALGGLIVLSVPAPPTSRRPFGLTFSRAWVLPLLVAILSIIQWGVIIAFLPLAASDAGVNPALLFSDEARRGTALAYFSVSFAVGMILGSSVGGLLYAWLQFRGLLIMGAILCCGGVVALLADSFALRRPTSSVADEYTRWPRSERESRGAPG